MPQYSIAGAQIIVYINEKKYNVAQSINFTVDYGEVEIYGIDSNWAQEIATTKCTVSGNINGIKIRNGGGIQAIAARSLIIDIISSPYISIRIQDRITQEDIIYIPRAKVSAESHSVAAKGIYKVNISFKGILPEFSLDRTS